MVRISVIIPVLDDAQLLGACLVALSRQTRPADEVLVVDNGSSDDSAAVALRSGARVATEPRRGILSATAAGFDLATADGAGILARLDADSIPAEDWLARIETVFDDELLDAVTGPGEFYGSNRIVHRLGEIVYLGGYFWSMGLVLGRPPLFGSNMAIRADAWRTISGSVHRDIRRVHDDLDISFALGPGARVLFDPALMLGISARPFASLATIRLRLSMAATTIGLNLREESLWHRRAAHRPEPEPQPPQPGEERTPWPSPRGPRDRG